MKLNWILIPLCIASFAACSSASSSPPPVRMVTLSASPSAYIFPLDNNTPEPVTVTRSYGTFRSLGLSVGDPTEIGVTMPSLMGGTATFTVIPIAHNYAAANPATTVTATDSTGASTSVSVTTAACGRPATLLGAQQVVPASSATGTSTSIGTLYFVAYFVSAGGPPTITGSLHLSVGTHGTLEGGPLVAATLPPGTTLPTPLPIPGATGVTVSATVPTLMTGQTYQTQLYNDTCQAPVVAGTFST